MELLMDSMNIDFLIGEIKIPDNYSPSDKRRNELFVTYNLYIDRLRNSPKTKDTQEDIQRTKIEKGNFHNTINKSLKRNNCKYNEFISYYNSNLGFVEDSRMADKKYVSIKKEKSRLEEEIARNVYLNISVILSSYFLNCLYVCSNSIFIIS